MLRKLHNIASALKVIALELKVKGDTKLAAEVALERRKVVTKKVEWIEAKCKCQGCPSYSECGGRLAFCYNGPARGDIARKGCLCRGCPVYKSMNFEDEYFCIIGHASVSEKSPEQQKRLRRLERFRV